MTQNKLPKDWKWVSISEIAKIETGTTPSKAISEYYGDEYPFYKPTDLEAGLNVFKSNDGLTKLGVDKARYVPENSTLVTCIGATIGKTGFLKKGGGFNQQINAIIPNENSLPKFIYYQAISLNFQKQIKDNASATTLPLLNKSKFQILKMVICSLETQQLIVSKIEELFSELDKGIEDLKLAQQQLKTYRQSVLKYAFEGRLTNKNVKDGVLPKGWEVVSITEIVEKNKHSLKAGPFGSSLKKEFYVPKGYKIYGQEQVISDDAFNGDYYVNEEKYQELKSCQIKPFDILISLVGTVGKVLILPENCKEGIINPRLIKISLERNVYLPNFFKNYFESSVVKIFYSGVTKGTTMDVLNLGIIKTIPFPLPSLKEQHKIVEEIESRLSVADKMEESINESLLQAEALRQSILKKAFEGKLV